MKYFSVFKGIMQIHYNDFCLINCRVQDIQLLSTLQSNVLPCSQGGYLTCLCKSESQDGINKYGYISMRCSSLDVFLFLNCPYLNIVSYGGKANNHLFNSLILTDKQRSKNDKKMMSISFYHLSDF